MTPPGKSDYGEDPLVEQPAIALFEDLGWQTADLFGEWDRGPSSEGRENEHEVILVDRLMQVLSRLNPDLPPQALDLAITELTKDRSKLIPVNANQETYHLLKDGVTVTYAGDRGERKTETVRVIDWRNADNNDFFLASQFWIAGDYHRRRPDLIGFVNGIPLVLFELKSPEHNVKTAYDDNLSDYRDAIPSIFLPNGFVILSNGVETKVGSSFAEWDHFMEWKRVEDESEELKASLEVAIRGTCAKDKLLDLVENFIVFEEMRGGLVKKMAKYHQMIGVNSSLRALADVRENQGRLGVFWHTQGSGKSLSMVFFCQKVLRSIEGNWTFVVVTDRDDLDSQIYKAFAATGAVTEPEDLCRAQSGAHLRDMLAQSHRYVFTLIQKFRTEPGETYSMVSERNDIIVITDEAHRSQYDTFALNMRNSMPNASYLGFTGTPLIQGEEQRTREVFGDYVSVYNFAQSVEDGATVKLFYENRAPEIDIDNPEFDADFQQILEDADLDEEQERRLARDFGQYHIITRDDRLEKIAEDIVRHFVNRGYHGKGMVISIDKATAVAMCDKVRSHWDVCQAELERALPGLRGEERVIQQAKIERMQIADMAVVVSQSQNEIAQMRERGLDIFPHRERMNNEDLDEKFKDPDDPLRLVFVCAMWITGFNVPTCSTIYLDKPMRNHTLMQTIARANRRAPGKEAGLIVDYANVFAALEQALAIYAAEPKGGWGEDEPIRDKSELVAALHQAVEELREFCRAKDVILDDIKAAQGMDKIALLKDGVDKLIGSEEDKTFFARAAGRAAKLFKAILPDPSAATFQPDVILLGVLAKMILSLRPRPDVSDVMKEIESLLDASIVGFPIPEPGEDDEQIDLTGINFDALRAKFGGQQRKRSQLEKLRALIAQKINGMVKQNQTRVELLEKFQKLVDDYNAGSKSIEAMFEELMRLAQELEEEERRAASMGLSEEELAVFDIITKPEPKLSTAQEAQVKRVCKGLLAKLKAEKLVLDWRTAQATRAGVRDCIQVELDNLPEDPYPKPLYDAKCKQTYRHVFDNYFGAGESIYGAAA